MSSRRAAFYTLGCKLNQYETEAIREAFEKAGYKTVRFDDEADVYVVNSCTVTSRGAANSRKMLRRAIRRNPEATVVAAGCHSEVAPEEFRAIEGVDIIVGNVTKPRIPELVDSDTRGVVSSDEAELEFEAFDISSFSEHSRAFIKIQEGCNWYCTYCLIPYARNTLKSRPRDSITQQVNTLVGQGYREVVVAGTHLGLYGADREDGTTLVDILKAICSETDLERMRLSSLEPMDITEELLDFIADEPRICRHFHLPLQSADNTVLQDMGRPYTTEWAEDLFKRIVERMPEVCLGTDIVVGFPGETEEQYRGIYDFLTRLPLGYIHVFPFSERPGTPAAAYEDKVHPETKKRRSKELYELRQEKIRTFKKRFVNTSVFPLVESRRDKTSGRLVGITDNYLRMVFEGPDSLRNSIVRVIPTQIEEDGTLVAYLPEVQKVEGRSWGLVRTSS